jgi:hypothetical protein
MLSRYLRRVRQRLFQNRFRRGAPRRILAPGQSRIRHLFLESLEDRRLLSITPLSAPQVAAFRDAVSAIDGFSSRIEDFKQLGTELPFLDQGIGDFVDIQGHSARRSWTRFRTF